MTIYLYVKEHSVTGLKYFGKTIRKDPIKYTGSGKYWVSHIKKHGKEYIKTLNVWEFYDQNECTKFAIEFSTKNNIVESFEWANLIPENGMDGGVVGIKHSLEHIEKRTKNRKIPIRKPHSEETKLKMKVASLGKKKTKHTKEANIQKSIRQTGKKYSPEFGIKISNSKKGVKPKQTTCPHCGMIGSLTTMKRWHYDNCKTIKD